MNALEFLHIFKKKPKQSYPLEKILGLGDIAEFFLRNSIKDEHRAIIGIEPRSIEQWFKGKNNKSTLEVLWPDVENCSTEHLSWEIEHKLSRDKKFLNDMALSLGVVLNNNEVVKSYFAWAIAEQWKAIGKGRGEAKKSFKLFYAQKVEYEELRRSGNFGNDSDGFFIQELYKAYGDAEKIQNFDKKDCDVSKVYSKDCKQRVSDFFAAEDYRRSVVGLHGDLFSQLKDKIYERVEPTASMEYKNGYQRMLKVMDKSMECQVSQSYFNDKDNPVEEKEKKGVCHHLVNDNRLVWVPKKDD
jgi:hypothetical protein